MREKGRRRKKGKKKEEASKSKDKLWVEPFFSPQVQTLIQKKKKERKERKKEKKKKQEKIYGQTLSQDNFLSAKV